MINDQEIATTNKTLVYMVGAESLPLLKEKDFFRIYLFAIQSESIQLLISPALIRKFLLVEKMLFSDYNNTSLFVYLVELSEVLMKIDFIGRGCRLTEQMEENFSHKLKNMLNHFERFFDPIHARVILKEENSAFFLDLFLTTNHGIFLAAGSTYSHHTFHLPHIIEKLRRQLQRYKTKHQKDKNRIRIEDLSMVSFAED